MSARLVGLRIDLETKSASDIKFGSYVYAEDPEFAVLITGYAPIREYPGGARKLGRVRILTPASAAQFEALVRDESIEKHAFNANFERICLSKHFGLPPGTYLDPKNWHCSAVNANVHGVFGTLDEVARAVRAPIRKDPLGKSLIKFFSIPDKKTGLFGDPDKYPAKFKQYQEYNKRDVVTEAVVAGQFPETPADVQAEYEADQRINDRGFRHWRTLSRRAVDQVKVEQTRLMGELRVMTGLDNPNSPKQMGEWLVTQGYPMVSLDKDHRAEALADPLCPDLVKQALVLKGMASLSSVTKHKAALDTRCADGRIRGSLRFYGAHTGREAGRGMQPQNLPRYEAPKADRVRLLLGTAGADAPQIAKGTVRASIVPAKGHVFATLDYNAIEARTLGWACGEAWVNDEFNAALGGQGKIYEATASMMFGLAKADIIAGRKGCGPAPDEPCGKDSCVWCAARSKGKVSNLALGYGGAAGALVTMGAEDAGIDCGNYKNLSAEWKAAGMPVKFHEWEKDRHDYPELIRLRDLYREASPKTTQFWKLCARAWDAAALGRAVRFGSEMQFTMMRDGRHNRLVLPSGRSIWYRFAAAHPSDTRPDHIDRRTFIGKGKGVGHVRTDTHGGKLTENINQAIARDVLFDLIMKVEAQKNQPGRIVLHVHDEVVLEVPEKHAEQRLADLAGLMSTPPDWAQTLFVKGEGKIMERYAK